MKYLYAIIFLLFCSLPAIAEDIKESMCYGTTDKEIKGTVLFMVSQSLKTNRTVPINHRTVPINHTKNAEVIRSIMQNRCPPIILLAGGEKSTQAKDIKTAIRLAKNL